jgi:CRISPR-associated endonuclease Cas3-HD
MLSNNKGHDLLQHLKATANVAKAMALKLGLSSELINKIYASALLHDIGKAVPSFQRYMNQCRGTELLIVDDSFQDPIGTLFPLHNEIGWAFLSQKMSDKNILNSVYWHHARPVHSVGNRKSTYDMADDILEELNDADKRALENLWVELHPMISCPIGNPMTGTIEVPDLFEKESGSFNRNDNAEFMLVRACLISADRHVSSLSYIEGLSMDDTLAMEEVTNLLSGEGIQGIPVKPPHYEQGRYDLQEGVVNSVGNSKTTIIKAPAGLGKTLIGILWAKMRGGRVIWVCPRNAVADAVYENIVREVEVLGLSCNVELYLTGKCLKKTNIGYERPEFSSDIVVTNIDAVLSPMVNNRVAGRLFSVFGSHIVLDEFHEFVSDAPLFAAFVTYMRARHRLSSNCKTLLLSATPSLVQCLWDTTEMPTLLLPNAESHYPPQHTGTYQVEFTEEFPSMATPGSLLVCNSVSEAQNNYRIGGYRHIIHHRYTEEDRKRIQDTLYNSFGKNKEGVSRGESLSAALVVQAAMDISFSSLFDSVCSPESSLQRIGRTDRWGTFQNLSPRITFMSMIHEKTERGAINTVYNGVLQTKWYDFLKLELNGISSVSLSRLYEAYNKFYQLNGGDVKEYLREQYKVGMNGPKRGMEFVGLVGFAPTKVLNPDPDRKSSNKNLRCPDGSYFYTVEFVGRPNEWLPPDEDGNPPLSEGHELYDLYSGKGELTAGLLTSGTMLTRLKGLVNSGFSAWTKHSKGKARIPDNLKDWFKRARNPETPLPDFSRRYDVHLGVVKKS